MSSKLSYSISDEKKNLQKQIGCMNGFFQLFDRQHFLSTRWLKNDAIKRLPSGKTGNRGTETKNAFGTITEDSNEMVREKQRTSTESSGTSVSSSSWSSTFSSLECNKANQLEQPIYSQPKFPETPSRNILMNQPNPPHSRRHSFDLQDVVKDNIHKGAQGLSIKTITEEKVVNQKFKHVDSPRPAQLPNSQKPKAKSLGESPRVLGKLGDVPSRFIENRSGSLPLRDASRFSYDGTELRDSSRSSMKVKELPRLSLDSKRGSVRDCNSTIRPNYLLADQQRGRGLQSNNLIYQQEPESYRGPSGVLARLMGLEALPSVTTSVDTKTGQNANCLNEHAPFSETSTFLNENELNKTPRTSVEGISPKFSDSVVKSCRTSKIAIETAPWRQQGESKGSCASTPKTEESSNNTNSFPSVYGEIEKRLAELEFRKSGRDLRALKQILEAMQKTKERLDSKKESYVCDSVSQTNSKSIDNQSFHLASPRSTQSDNRISSTVKAGNSPKNSKPAILIMRPSKLAENAGSASFRSATDSPSRLKKLWTGDSADSRRELESKQPKDVNPRKHRLRDSSAQIPFVKDRNTKVFTQYHAPQQTQGESSISSYRSSGSVSPRPREKKLAPGNNSHSSTASTDASIPRSIRKCSKQSTETDSPRRKLKPRTSGLQQDGVQVKKISNNIRYQRDQDSMSSQKLSSTITSASHTETEATSTDGSDTVTGSFFGQAGQTQTNLVAMFGEEKSVEGDIKVTLEQPSPVSVLEAPFYGEEPPSPIKKISSTFRDDQPVDIDEAEQKTNNLNPVLATKIRRNNIPNLPDLAPYLEQNDLFVKTNPNHTYILEILTASGLLTGADHDVPAVQLLPTGYLLDPKLFFLLEKTKTSIWSEENDHSNHYKKPERQLTFDALNEILRRKLVVEGSLRPNRMAKRRLTGKQLFIDICTEIDLLQTNTTYCIDDEEDYIKGIMLQDLTKESVSWTDSQQEFSRVVLDVERLIFKDLINEVVSGGLKISAGRHCRQLFN